MRILHVSKTSDGAHWAVAQVRELVGLGVDVHVALPQPTGAAVAGWIRSGAKIHIVPLDYPAGAPWRFRFVCESARRLVAAVAPDLIHSHFVGTTLTLRAALGKRHPIPRLFQVAGPLHLEHRLFRRLDLASAGSADAWVASSRCILNHYLRAKVDPGKLFLSYYGTDTGAISQTRTYSLRKWLGIDESQLLVGNICHIYPPKYHLGQMRGIKGHENLIDALAIVTRSRPDVTGALVGGAWNGATWYENRLRSQAVRAAGVRVKMPGPVDGALAAAAWADFDCVVHTPTSENCGGVIEPLLAGVPTVASAVGGLPEVIIDGVTGYAVPPRDAGALADRVLQVLENPEDARVLAAAGQHLVRTMFDVRRTAREIYKTYEYILAPGRTRPQEFEPALPATNRCVLQ